MALDPNLLVSLMTAALAAYAAWTTTRTKKKVDVLEVNTNSKMDQLLAAKTAQAAAEGTAAGIVEGHAAGLDQGRNEERKDPPGNDFQRAVLTEPVKRV